jgi:hypothetical protein
LLQLQIRRPQLSREQSLRRGFARPGEIYRAVSNRCGRRIIAQFESSMASQPVPSLRGMSGSRNYARHNRSQPARSRLPGAASGFATSRVCSMKSCATGLVVRFFKVMNPSGDRELRCHHFTVGPRWTSPPILQNLVFGTHRAPLPGPSSSRRRSSCVGAAVRGRPEAERHAA